MKKLATVLLLATTILLSPSCAEKFGVVKQISIEAESVGFTHNGEATKSAWADDIYLFSMADTTPKLFTIASGKGSSVATFSGTITTQPSYIGFYPAPVMTQATSEAIEFTIEEPLVAFSCLELSLNTPKMGEGSRAAGMTFRNVFGAVELPLVNGSEYQTSSIKVVVSSQNAPLTGMYACALDSGDITSYSGNHIVTKKFEDPTRIESSSVFVALPAGEYPYLQISFLDLASNTNKTFKAEKIVVKEGEVTTTEPLSATILAPVVGDWHLTSFCGTAAEVDLYISFKDDYSFTLHQRSGSMGYVTFTGEWKYDNSTSTLSGEYSDGSAWATSYKVTVTDKGDLQFVNVNNADEVAVYSSTTIPTISTSSSRATTDVKPFL